MISWKAKRWCLEGQWGRSRWRAMEWRGRWKAMWGLDGLWVGGCRRAVGMFDRWRAMGWGLEGFRGCREWLTMRLRATGTRRCCRCCCDVGRSLCCVESSRVRGVGRHLSLKRRSFFFFFFFVGASSDSELFLLEAPVVGRRGIFFVKGMAWDPT